MGNEVSTIVGASFVAPSHHSGGLLVNSDRMEFGWRAAQIFAGSQLVPKHMQGKREDCFIALHMAERLNEDPLIVMQNIVLVAGSPGWKAQYMIARANASGLLKGRIKWRVSGAGDALAVVAYATMAADDEVVESPEINFAMAKAEGWTSNKKYQSMPEVMFRYRSAAFLIRFNMPEVMLGMQTAEEVEDSAFGGEISPDAPPRPTMPSQAAIEGPKAPKPKAARKDEPRAVISLTDTDGQVVDYPIPAEAAAFEADFIAQMNMAAAAGPDALAGLIESNGQALEQLRADGHAEMLEMYDRVAAKAENLGAAKLPAADAPAQGALY